MNPCRKPCGTAVPTTSARRWYALIFAGWVLLTAAAQPGPLFGQDEVGPQVDDSMLLPGSEPAGTENVDAGSTTRANETELYERGLNLFDLLSRGGWFMIPLALLSLGAVALTVERLLALRESRMLPSPFVRELGSLSRSDQGFDPRLAFRACQSHPSAAARVIRVMLLKAGRPQSEIETSVREAAEREAGRLQGTVSWLTLVAAVAPLIGLLGTVWGMIQAFYDTTQLVAGQNKAEVLAQGIYTALVTTLSGLIIAIPAAIVAHFFDTRIVSWFHRIEELAASLVPMLEPFEGKMRAGIADLDSPAPFDADEIAAGQDTAGPRSQASGGNRRRGAATEPAPTQN